MRIWSLHPKYLDSKGLVALWREALLAKHVLEGKTREYRHHPQLVRFKKTKNPLDCIHQYLTAVYQEAVSRGYHFNKDKINREFKPEKINLTSGQLDYEAVLLIKKLKERNFKKYNELRSISSFEPHPLFSLVPGAVEKWEKIKNL
jgi:hypothetical protein